ncbi:hypothetical protein NXW71_03250 [Parabacteroides merdae]|nr:hypothetical protein [Parabacteroides merdae]
METTKTVLAPGERITVIDALRGFSLIGICLIHSMQHFGAMGTMTSQAVFPWEGTMNEIFSWLINYPGFREILHYLLLPVRFKFLYPDGSGGEERT